MSSDKEMQEVNLESMIPAGSATAPAAAEALRSEDPTIGTQTTLAGSNKSVLSEKAGSGVATPPKKEAINHDKAPMELGKLRFWSVYLAQLLTIFLFSLDQLIVATAIPKITVEFDSLQQIPWLANGFFITLLAFNLMYSQWLNIFPSKAVVIGAVVIFEAGSILCGAAPNMIALIFGRAVAGLGAAGIFSGNLVILAEITSMKDRGKYMSFIGVVFAISSVLGPLVGGAFSDHVSWRWCFYINAPIGGLALAAMVVFLPSLPPLGQKETYKGWNTGMIMQFVKCDWVGCTLILGWATAFILAFQWGGATKPWSDGGVITCLVLIFVIAGLFFGWEWWIGEKYAMLPLALLRRKTLLGVCILMMFLFALFIGNVYYISLDYQAVYGISATGAGIRLLPMVLPQIVIMIGSAVVIRKSGRYWYFLVGGNVISAVGSGLLYSISPTSKVGAVMGFSALIGIGVGCCLQNGLLVAQFEFRNEPWLISKGTGVATFASFVGRILGISFGNSLFQNLLVQKLDKVPGLSLEAVAAVVSSADAVYTVVPDNLRSAVLAQYLKSMCFVFILGVPYAALALVGAFLIPNYNMNEQRKTENKAGDEEKAEAPVAMEA